MGLDELQRRLESHFGALHKKRTTETVSQPVFALEHGLSSEELAELREKIHAHIRSAPPLKGHALPWLVYAAEMGYRYSGDEYWQTFEAETPGWTLFGSRTWIRNRFKEFHSRFGGAKPTGRWAEWFVNICWPITHAILPTDLQRQLAKILYENRHAFSPDLFQSPAKLGALIAARSLNASTRFRQLAQQPLLLGQIAAALLLDDKDDGKSLILPSTLHRIATDLERERQSKEWLRAARQHINSTRVRVGGGIPRPRTGSLPAGGAETLLTESTLGLEPRLVAQPTGLKAYDLYAEIPNLSPLLIRFPELHEVLNGSRCIVAGAAGSPLWQGRVLRAAQLVRLTTWPPASEPLFRFERSHRVLDYLLGAESFRRPGSQWLFRVATDGRAYEQRSLNVRAGGKYLLLRNEPFTELIDNASPVALRCLGVHALELAVPSAVTDAFKDGLRALGLNHAKILDVWPAGAPPAGWDGESQVEWLTTDFPILGVRSDHALKDLAVLLDANEWTRVHFSPVEPGKAYFVELPELAVGPHRLTFRLQSNDNRISQDATQLIVVIREPHEWIPGVTAQGAFMVLMDPTTPTLEQLWEGRVSLEIHGPAGRQVTGAVSLMERALNRAPLAEVVLPPIPLPVTAIQWEQFFEKHVRNNKAVANSYDAAQMFVLELSAEELGRFRVECEREFEPVRWALRRGTECYQAKVVTDRGDDKTLQVVRYDLSHPEQPIILDSTTDAHDVPQSGSLYTATSDQFTKSILVPPFHIHSFEDLRVNIDIDISDHSVEHLLRLIAAAELWVSTRMTGSELVASIQIRNRVVDVLLRAIASSVAGGAWQREEAIYAKRSDPGALPRLLRAIAENRREYSIAAVVERDISAIAALPIQQRVTRVRDLTSKFVRVSDPWLVEFALRLASGCVQKWAGADIQNAIERIKRKPVIMRVARAVVLGVASGLSQGASVVGPVYAGWQWE